MGREVTGRGILGSAWLALVVFFSPVKGAFAQTESHPTPAVRNVNVSDFFVPSELGYVIETHKPAAPTGAATVIHIQEAHTNYEGQQHIVSILERLIQQHGLRLVLVEGGQGDLSLAYLRRYGPPENRRQVADKYLRTGVITAEEYMDITSDYPMTIWGVEQPDLYQQNLEAFLEADRLAATLKPLLVSVKTAVEALKPKLSDPALLNLETDIQAFQAERLSLGDYVDRLAALAEGHGVSMTQDTFPNLARFLSVRTLERTIEPTQVSLEQRAVMTQLAQRVASEKLDALLEKAQRANKGSGKREDFYLALEQLAAESELSLEPSPHLSRYLRYLKDKAQLNPTTLARELDEFAAALRKTLTASPRSQQLQTIAEQANLMEKLLDLRLSPAEFQQLQALDLHAALSTWKTFLTAQLASQNLLERSFAQLGELEAAVPRLVRFYDTANQRDAALVQGALDKLKETQEPLAVLITGGFHSPRITELLSAHGLGVVVLTPKVSHPTDERLYRAVLKYKSGQGSFDEVMAIASNQQTAE